jgi:pyruvate dehydrogenase E1 component alpha subunit
VRAVVERALSTARAGGGPSLVECDTYRLCDHTTADDASRYRDPAEVSARWKDEPMLRLRAHLVACGAWDKERERRLLADCTRQVEEAAAAYLAYPPAPPSDMFDHLFATLPDALAPERRAVAGAGEPDA